MTELELKVRRIMVDALLAHWAKQANLNLADIFQESEAGKMLIETNKSGDEYLWNLIDDEAEHLSTVLYNQVYAYMEEGQ